MHVRPLTPAIGAEISGVNLAEAARNDDLFGAIKAALLEHKVLFLRDQDITRADHVAFAERFGRLEDHPVAGSDPDHPGLVRIYKDENSPPDFYENSWHADTTWREAPQMGAVLRCVAVTSSATESRDRSVVNQFSYAARSQRPSTPRVTLPCAVSPVPCVVRCSVPAMCWRDQGVRNSPC